METHIHQAVHESADTRVNGSVTPDRLYRQTGHIARQVISSSY